MKRPIILHVFFFLLLSLAGCAADEVTTAVATVPEIEVAGIPTIQPTPSLEMAGPASCPITQPPEERFVPPAPYSEQPPAGGFWYGTNELWLDLRSDGTWPGLPKSATGYGNKIALWHEGYSQSEEPQPEITLSARQLDGDALVEPVVYGTNAYHPDYGQFMMTGIELPTLGCWEITAEHKGASLSFVVWVAP